MDKKAAAESKEKSGWCWRPLRDKDHLTDMSFGVEAKRLRNSSDSDSINPASDYYIGARNLQNHDQSGRSTTYLLRSPMPVYDKTIPLHALRKVAAIERDFKSSPVSFFVCDYALAPAIQYPDPFLMAVIPNSKLNIGVGRFIIDFWDEPGFGFDNGLLGGN
jgi:hypothetical protein